jgi:hypothetical protein
MGIEGGNTNNSNDNKSNNNNGKDFIQRQKETYASNMVQSATEHMTKSWYEKFICGLE